MKGHIAEDRETLLKPLEELNAFQSARECIQRNQFPIHLSGCIDGQKSQLMAGLSLGKKWTVVITSNEKKGRELLNDLQLYDKAALYYPAKDIIFFSADVHGNALEMERLRAIELLLSQDAGTVVTTMAAGMELVQSLQVYRDARLSVQEGEELETEPFFDRLMNMGYERTPQVSAPGEFSVRGDIIDIFCPTRDCPFRMELFGDEIDMIREFDVESQRSSERLEKVEIFPAAEIILTQEQIADGLEKMKKDQKKMVARWKKEKNLEAANRIGRIVSEWKERLEYARTGLSMESYLPYFDSRTESFFDYFDPEETLFFIDEPSMCSGAAQAVETEFCESMENRLKGGYILPGQMEVMYGVDVTEGLLQRKNTIFLSVLDSLPRNFSAQASHNILCQSVSSYNKHFEMLAEDIQKWKQHGGRVLLLSASRTRAQRLSQDLTEFGVNAFYREAMDEQLQPGMVMVSYGKLSKGFSYDTLRFYVVTEGDVFGKREKKKRQKQKKYSGQTIQSLHELNIGDYVVHENHGLGIYRGIEKITVDHVSKDFIKVEYGDGGNLYVPVSSLDTIQKYASQAAKAPKLNKLNSVEWQKTKSRVKKAVQEIAKDLVELYAKRQEQEGFVFEPDTVWQKEFEEMFPFEETQDQLDAIEEMKKDMESHKIMDRLICGDVGYGKTEVAIRAAFKAVDNGKQVAFLVPTTILAQQHYNTIRERMGDYPVNVEMLSRFRTPSQQKKTLEKMKTGAVDIVIGTHRLLSKDVKFKNLGLLIVDEEQRFGVTHKEKIKKMKQNVDVLTLSATPIPRTLHMSLVGIRDMSVLEEPPVDRLPIQTFVMEHNSEIIREAIQRELNRGGQVYYVYNRVRNIQDVAGEVLKLVPDANVAYAHGQMSERQLEDIMMEFIQGEIDVLVATTIIETGLDISNVNTIIIDNADKMGLSQLYQLRGRVGRSNRTAYAFLMYKRDKILREVAEKRLEAIKEHTALGSGIRVAMRDLEIRGAGNLLGEAQSGHMADVGYDLYCKMLNEAVLRLKGQKEEDDDFETTIDFGVDALIPAGYIKSEYQKLDMYKRISYIQNEDEKSDMEDELIDRYGEIPKATQNLLQIALLKAKAHNAQIEQISQKPEGIRFYLRKQAKIASERIPDMLESFGGKLKCVSKKETYFLYVLPSDGQAGKPMSQSRMYGAPSVKKKEPVKKDANSVLQCTEEVIGKIYELAVADEEKKKEKENV